MSRLLTVLSNTGGFLPKQIPDLVLHLDATTITGLAAGDPVGTWTDASGSGNHATQATAAKQPSYQANIQNAKPVVRFDGVDDVLALASNNPLGGAAGATCFVVGRLAALLGANAHFLRQETGAAFGIGNTNEEIGGYVHTGGWVGNWDAGTTTLATATGYLFTYQYDGAAFDMRLNSASNITPFAATGSITAGTDATIGAYEHPTTGTQEVLNGDIAELVLYRRSLTTAERTQIEDHLKQKWGIV